MIERIDDMPSGTIGFRVAGHLTREDYMNVLAPELRKQVSEQSNGLRALYLIESLDKMDPSALWEDAKLGLDVGVRHHDAWKRSAIVTDIDWLARAARLFTWMIPGEARVYPRAELGHAKRWLAGLSS